MTPDADRPIDLHAHTTASDGGLTPAELVAEARRLGLAAVAVTDHDAVEGVAPALAAAAALPPDPAGRPPIEIVPGVELTAYAPPKIELHLLGYFVEAAGLLGERLAHFRDVRRARAEQFVANLRALGLPVEFGDVLAAARGNVLGRPHLAMALLKRGCVATTGEAFQRYLSEDSPAYVPKERLTPVAALELVHAAGGLCVLAHPGVGGREVYIPVLAQLGLDGLEVRHPFHSALESRYLEELCAEHNLARTGGSDFHGGFDRAQLGAPRVPYAWLEELRQRRR